ncbi:hypothetical protein ACOBQX_28020 [Actinokineospora sp. G85]|uniref:hypothetical protein n=1 Tax=Actinokineospora sp. G85 TaxID=3406626 RepID=UPI003C7433E5
MTTASTLPPPHPPAPFPRHPPAPARSLWYPGLVAVLPQAGAAAMALLGLFGAQFTFGTSPYAERTADDLVVGVTVWEFSLARFAGGESPLNQLGVPALVAAIVLALAAALTVAAVFVPDKRLVTGVRVLTGAGAAVLATTTVAVALFVAAVADASPEEAFVETADGYVLLIIGAVLGVVAVAPTLVRRERRVEPPTPPMGFRAPLGVPAQGPPAQRFTPPAAPEPAAAHTPGEAAPVDNPKDDGRAKPEDGDDDDGEITQVVKTEE